MSATIKYETGKRKEVWTTWYAREHEQPNYFGLALLLVWVVGYIIIWSFNLFGCLFYPEAVVAHIPEKPPIVANNPYIRLTEDELVNQKEVWVTAYNSEVGQCDNDPYISASGRRVYDGMVAMNGVDYGTKIIIDGRIYEVWDRKNSRYGDNWVDIWMADREEAVKWGIQKKKVLIIK